VHAFPSPDPSVVGDAGVEGGGFVQGKVPPGEGVPEMGARDPVAMRRGRQESRRRHGRQPERQGPALQAAAEGQARGGGQHEARREGRAEGVVPEGPGQENPEGEGKGHGRHGAGGVSAGDGEGGSRGLEGVRVRRGYTLARRTTVSK
jgi:hypothetical protein